MKSGKRNSNTHLPLLKRSSTPCITQRRNSIAKAKSSKGKKINTDPLPSPNSSFTEELMKQIRKTLSSSKNSSRNSSPLAKIKLAFYIKIENKLWEMVQNVQEPKNFSLLREEYWETIKTSKIHNIEDCFKELKSKKWVRKALIVELCGVMISGELYRTDDAINNLKNLMLFIHQNYIEILYLLYSKVRLPATIMFKKLQDIISSRRMNNVTQKAISLNQSTEILSGLLKEICKHFRKNSKQTALSTSIFSILKTANKLTYIIVKDALSQAISLSEPIMIKPNEPFLPHSPSGTYTLVLDLDETLVHFVQSEEEGTVFIRPGCEDFIKAVSEWYEVVIFTAGLQDVIFN
jgi:CTD small phosphatase-like protein 2